MLQKGPKLLFVVIQVAQNLLKKQKLFVTLFLYLI